MKQRPEWFKSVENGKIHVESVSDMSDNTGEGGPTTGECGDGVPDG